MLSPIIFKLNDKTYRVKKKEMWQKDFEHGTAYLLSKYNNYVFPYRGKIDDIDDAVYPGLYKMDGVVFAVYPMSDDDKKIYSKERLIYLTPDSIFKNLDDGLVQIPQDVITDGDIFKPAIKQTDDIALAAMKYAIGQKNINFNTYAHRFPDMATKNNGRRALTHGNTLKMDMLSRFADVFDINAALVLWDKKGCKNPMAKNYDKAYIIFNNDKIDLKDDSIKIEEISREG